MFSNYQLQSILKKLLIYIVITLIPSLVISYYFAQHEVKVVEISTKNKAQKYANVHAMNLEKFIGETVGRLEMLASSIKTQHSNLINIETILKETQAKDLRFSGFYFASSTGNLLISTNPTSSLVNVGDRDYFHQAIRTEQTSISEPHIGRVTGRYVITIATPIVDHGNIKSVLLASLRIDEFEKSMIGLINDEQIIVADQKEETLIQAGKKLPLENTVKSSIHMTQVPWTITAMVVPESKHIFRNTYFQYFFIFLILTNILYLLAQYLHLRKKVEQEKKQTELQKLELIGNLAASTAHEIKNPLTGIKGLVTLLSEEHSDTKSQYYFQVIQQEIDRINAIVSELLVLGKPTAYKLNTFDVNTIVKEIEPIILSEANFMNVELMIHYGDVDLPISCVKDNVKQVLLNLAKNALQAMPNGGKLTIILKKNAESCLIHVADTGVGMGKEQLKKAFTPFYSMKKEGSGLGLTICKRIIETFGGKIFIKSSLNAGTQVEITLPLSYE
ncbi:ATP-binding protein [Neobacillus vireti]|uniref:ATP-binding protein n=1 Tax=Neobacillus vireti TaxID=220686 RepID=UPI002FFFA861